MILSIKHGYSVQIMTSLILVCEYAVTACGTFNCLRPMEIKDQKWIEIKSKTSVNGSEFDMGSILRLKCLRCPSLISNQVVVTADRSTRTSLGHVF